MGDEPRRELDNVDVVTEGLTYRDATIEQYAFWSRIITNRHQPEVDPIEWVPNVRIKRVVT